MTTIKSQIDPEFIPAWAKGIVWYQIFPERFRTGDPNNDPTAADNEGSYPHNRSTGRQVHPWTAEWYAQQAYEQLIEQII